MTRAPKGRSVGILVKGFLARDPHSPPIFLPASGWKRSRLLKMVKRISSRRADLSILSAVWESVTKKVCTAVLLLGLILAFLMLSPSRLRAATYKHACCIGPFTLKVNGTRSQWA